MKLADNYVAVGAAIETDAQSCVIIVADGIALRLPELAARKLANDILSTANYLWPIEEQK